MRPPRTLSSAGRPQPDGAGDIEPPATLRGAPSDPDTARATALFENIPWMYFALDSDGVVLSVNTQGARELGYEPHELVGKQVLEVFHPEDRDAVERQLGDSQARPGDVVEWELRKVRRDGSTLWVRESVRTVQHVDGRRETLVACQNVTELKRIEETLRRNRGRLRTLTAALALAGERERRRIADGMQRRIGATLECAKTKLTEARRSGLSAESMAELGEQIARAIQATRSLTFELSSPILYELGLEAAVEDLGERVTAQNGMSFRFESDGRPKPLTDDTRIVLFRLVREILLNAAQHARASAAAASVRRVGHRIRITLEDDGLGFDPAAIGEPAGANDGFGLFGAREHVHRLGGSIEIQAAPGRGTRVVLEAPLESGSEGDGSCVAR